MILSFQTDRSGQTVQNHFSLSQGLHCLQFRLYLLATILYGKATVVKFKGDYSTLFEYPNFLDYYGRCFCDEQTDVDDDADLPSFL